MTTARRLAAIFAADMVGYSAAMECDEERWRLCALRQDEIEPRLAEYQGRPIKTTGDGFLPEFASPIAALECALAIQQRLEDIGGLRLRLWRPLSGLGSAIATLRPLTEAIEKNDELVASSCFRWRSLDTLIFALKATIFIAAPEQAELTRRNLT